MLLCVSINESYNMEKIGDSIRSCGLGRKKLQSCSGRGSNSLKDLIAVYLVPFSLKNVLP